MQKPNPKLEIGLGLNQFGLGGFQRVVEEGGGGGGDALLLETGDSLLLETGDRILLE